MLGITISIMCSLVWSVAVVMFKRTGDDLHPVVLNLFKNIVGLLLFIPTVLIVEGFAAPQCTWPQLAILAFSGMIGIGAADAMVLKALKEAGASRLAIVECTYSPFVIFLSLYFLDEKLTLARFLGAVLVLIAIVCVSITREPRLARSGQVRAGMLWGILGIMTMAGGIVMIKPLFSAIPLFWIITIRLAAGVLASLGIFATLKDKSKHLRQASAGTTEEVAIHCRCAEHLCVYDALGGGL